MYSSYSAAAFALRVSKPSLHAHSSYSYAYLPSHHCHRNDDAGGGAHHELLPHTSSYLTPRFLLDGYLLRHSVHLLLLSARLHSPPHPSHPPRCCHRRAAPRCCDRGSRGLDHRRVTCRAEPRVCRCSSGCGAARSDLGAACRRVEARGCCCGGSGGGRSLGGGCRQRDAPRLVHRAVREEVWEYDGEWPHRRCSVECHCDWEQEEEEEFAGDLQLSGGRWEDDDDVYGSKHRCRDSGQRNSYYSSGDACSGRRRDVNEYCGGFRDSDRRRRQSWEGRDRREHDLDDTVDTKRVGNRKYVDDGRKYNRRRESRNFDYDDAADVRRSGRYAEDGRITDRRTEYRDFEIDDEVDVVRREGRRSSNDDQRYVMRSRRVDDGGDDSLLRSRHRNEYGQDLDERRYYSEGRFQKLARAYELYEDDENRASSSRNTFDSRHARHEENYSSRVRWHNNLDRQTSDERYNDDTQVVRVRDTSRTGTQDVKVITEDDTRLASSSNNTFILKHSSNLDQKAAVRNDESRKSSQNIMEISEVRGNNIKQDTSTYHQENMRDYVENISSSLESSVKMASDSRRQVDRHSEINEHFASLAESRKNTEKFTDVTTDSSGNVSSASHLRRNYDEVNQMDVDDRSASTENITHVTRDKKRIVNQKVIHESDIDVQNVTTVDVSKIQASDISVFRGSQNDSKTGSDVNASSSMNFIDNARGQEERVYKNKVYSSDSTMVRGPQSHLEAEVYSRVHSTPSTNISDNTKGTLGQVELTKAHAENAAVASTLESQLQTRTDDQLWSTSAVNTVSSVSKQHDLAEIQPGNDSAVIISQGFHIRNGNQDHRMSTVNSSMEHRGMDDKQSTQDSITQRIKFAESSQESREKLARLEDTERLMQHNMDLIWQKTATSRISHDKDITSLQIDNTEDGSSIVNTDMAQQAVTTGSNEPEARREPTAESSVASGSNARLSVNESLLESAAQLEKSSTFHVRQFVDELQKGVSDTDIASTKKNVRSTVEGITSSRSQTKGPPDEMWDVQSTTSQETFKTADKEEGSSADGASNSASETPNNESALAKRVHKSLWAYVADIIHLGWIQRSDSHESNNRSVKKSSSSNFQGTEGWVSCQEHDNDAIIRKKYESTKEKDQQLRKSHSGEAESRVVSLPKMESLHTGTQVLRISGGGNLPRIGTSEENLLATSPKGDQNTSGDRFKQSALGELPKGSSEEDSTPALVDVTKGQSLDTKAATSSRNTTKGSGEVNTGKGMQTDMSSVTISSAESGHSGDGADWRYSTSGAIIPYHSPTQAMMPYDNNSAAMLESPALPVGGSMSFEEKNAVQEALEVIRTEAEDVELKRRMLQRNKQVLKETFHEWEEAYKLDAKLRNTHELFMREALLEAQKAADIWEVPVGAVLVQNGEIIARGCNLVEDLRDSTAHAEIVCIREASNKLKSWRLADTTLYVTLEPCAMCAGAILQARIDTVVWGAPNKLLGADGSWVRLFPGDGQTSTLDSANQSQTAGPVHPFHPKITIRRGVLASECSEIMQQFFQLRRKKQRPQSPPRAHHEGRHHPLKFFSKMHNVFGANLCL